MENKNVDVLIIGSGVSGLYSALNLSDDLDILVISKGKIDCTNTYLAQGGISVALSEKDDYHWQILLKLANIKMT